MDYNLSGKTFLITGITDRASLALPVAKKIQSLGGNLVCTALGLTPHHDNLSDKAKDYLTKTYNDFKAAVSEELGSSVKTYPLDVTLDGSIDDFAKALKSDGIELDGYLHSIAMDKTIRAGVVKPLIEVICDEFMGAMDVSAYSLISLSRALVTTSVLKKGSSIAAFSYLGAEKIVVHPYKNIGVAKAALERIVFELSFELGKSHQIRVNAIRFSPYTASKAGGAIQGLGDAVAHCEEASPLGNAQPEDLALETVYLLCHAGRITGEIRHVDGGYHIRG
jgi:enoyl-[acyl-carrier protein] reductase I